MNASIKALRLRQLLFLLILVLTFEGLARKAIPDLNIEIFLLKDFLVALMAFYVLVMPPTPPISFLWVSYKTVVVLFVPLVIITGWYDPLLALFGAKQYLLYPIVGFATFHAFQFESLQKILAFFRWVSLLIIPTAMMSLLQLHLPHDHWLNETVGGESLEGFSAAGQLRISSTFSFVAQYCAFLNAQAFIIMLSLTAGWRHLNTLWKILLLSLLPFLVMSSFSTGSRGAVAGNTAIFLLAGGLVMLKFKASNIIQVLVVIVGLLLTVELINVFSPQTMAAYSDREGGQLIGISSSIQGRVFNSFFAVGQDDSLSTFFGNGLGVMSNGSETFSNYASDWRDKLWTETDFASTLFEGGYYLVVIWYGFRLFVIFIATRRFVKEVSVEYSVSAAFIQAFVIIIGIEGTLGIQPPIAIWWWLGVGTSLVFAWKSVAPPEWEEGITVIPAPPPPVVRRPRGRSLYADVLHSRK